MAVTSQELVWHNSAFGVGGGPTGSDWHDLEGTLTAAASTGDTFLEDTALGGADGDHDGKLIIFVGGTSDLFVAKIVRSIAGSGYVIDAPMEASASIGDTYRVFPFVIGNMDANGQDCAEGRNRHRAWYCRNDGVNGVDEIYLWIKVVRNPGHFDWEVFGDDDNGGTSNMPVIQDQFAGPTQTQLDAKDPVNEFNSPKSQVAGKFMNPRRTNAGSDTVISAGNSYGLYVRRTIEPNTPPSEAIFVLVFEGRDQDTTNLIRVGLPLGVDADGFTPDLDLAFDRIVRVNGGARVNAVLRAQETGAVVEATELAFKVGSGPGVMALREDGSVTDDEGETFGSYVAPVVDGPITDSFMTDGVLPEGYALTRLTADYDGSFVDSAGVMQDAAANAARWTYDPITLTLRGLLNEPARTNLQADSEVPKSGTANYGTSPATFTPNYAGLPLLGVNVTRVENATPSVGQNEGAIPSTPTVSGATAGRKFVLSEYVQNNGGAQTLFELRLREEGGVEADDFFVSGENRTFGSAVSRVEAQGDVVEDDRTDVTGFCGRATDTSAVDFVHGFVQIEEVPGSEEAAASSWIRTTSAAAARARDTLTRSGLPNGVYDVTIERDGVADEVISGVLITGTYEVPTSIYPLRSVTYTPASAGESVTVEARI